MKQVKYKQLLIAIVVVVLVNVISQLAFFRLDLTSEKRYTLSDNTNKLLRNLDNTVYVKIFLDGDLNVGFTRLSKSAREMLDEFRVYAGNNIEYQFVDPTEGSESERKQITEELEKMGMSPQQVFETTEDGRQIATQVYPYGLVYYSGRVLPINLLENLQGKSGAQNLNSSVEGLEYKFANAIRRISSDKKNKVAFIEGHNELDEYDVLDITDYLSQYYQVDRGVLGSDPTVLDDYEAIIVAKPRNKFSESDKYILDQYFMKGGKVLWLVDAVNVTVDSLMTTGESIGLLSDVNLNDQLFKYGVRINPVLIEDLQSGMIPLSVANNGQSSKIVPAPWVYNPLLEPNQNSPIGKNINVVSAEFASSIDTVNSGLNLKRTVLLSSSQYTKSTQVPVMISLSQVNQKPDVNVFNQSDLPVAVLQEGVFPSVFQNRMIPNGIKASEKPLNASVPTKMIVIADGDIIKNKVRFKSSNPKVLPLGYDELTKQTFGNKDFILNCVNYLCDDGGWMSLKARSYALRMLDRNKIANESTKYKFINVVLPLIILLIMAVLVFVYRRWRFR